MNLKQRKAQLIECIQTAINNGVGAVIPIGRFDYGVCDDMDIRFHTDEYLMQIFVSSDKTYLEVCFRAIPSDDETLDDLIRYILDAGAVLNERLDPILMTQREMSEALPAPTNTEKRAGV